MRINHLFISSVDVPKSAQFYCDLLGFTPTRKFDDGAGDSQIVHKEINGHDLDLLIIPIEKAKLQHAQHMALETESAAEFDAILKTAYAMDLEPRAGVPLDSAPGVDTFSMNGKTYRHFYVLDPSWVNVEIMCRT